LKALTEYSNKFHFWNPGAYRNIFKKIRFPPKKSQKLTLDFENSLPPNDASAQKALDILATPMSVKCNGIVRTPVGDWETSFLPPSMKGGSKKIVKIDSGVP